MYVIREGKVYVLSYCSTQDMIINKYCNEIEIFENEMLGFYYFNDEKPN